MRPRWLIVGLVISVALNLFLLGAGAAVFALARRVASEPRLGALAIATQGLSQPNRHDFRLMLRQTRDSVSAQTAQSRNLRLAAYGALAGAKPDAVAIKAQLAQSRQIDIGVRQQVEEKVVDYTLTLPAADRASFANGMRRVMTPPPANK
ncbi:MAG TPA: periplasmic heavy metal sensor [Caulobacteraceae bacterium]